MINKEQSIKLMSLVDEKYVTEADPTMCAEKIRRCSQKFSIRKLTAVAASLCILAFAIIIPLNLSTRQDKPIGDISQSLNGFESGFHPQNDAILPYFCAIKSDKSEFNLDEVKVNFYFGTDKDVFYFHGNVDGITNAKLFINSDNTNYFVRNIDDYCSEEYLVTPIYSEGFKEIIELEFNHFEEVSIPREVFVNSSGNIQLQVRCDKYRLDNSGEDVCLLCKSICYQVNGDKVTLSI